MASWVDDSEGYYRNTDQPVPTNIAGVSSPRCSRLPASTSSCQSNVGPPAGDDAIRRKRADAYVSQSDNVTSSLIGRILDVGPFVLFVVQRHWIAGQRLVEAMEIVLPPARRACAGRDLRAHPAGLEDHRVGFQPAAEFLIAAPSTIRRPKKELLKSLSEGSLAVNLIHLGKDEADLLSPGRA